MISSNSFTFPVDELLLLTFLGALETSEKERHKMKHNKPKQNYCEGDTQSRVLGRNK